MAMKGKAASSRKVAKPKSKRGSVARKATARAAAPRAAAKAAKSAGRPASRPAKTAVAARFGSPAKRVPAKSAPAKPAPGKPQVPVKPAPGKFAVPVKPAPGKFAVPAKPAPGKFAVPAKPAPGKYVVLAKPGKPAKAGARPKPMTLAERQAIVRPLGVLPPSAMAKTVARAAPPPRPSKPVTRPKREKTPDEGAQGVSQQDYAEFEKRLLDERQKLLKEMGHLENTVLKINQRDSTGDLSGYAFHMADVGTDAMEREKAFLFASNEGHLLREIDEALRKVYSGGYGVCEICERPIARARLEAVPAARLCKSCKETEERAGRGMS